MLGQEDEILWITKISLPLKLIYKFNAKLIKFQACLCACVRVEINTMPLLFLWAMQRSKNK